ncbi:MAG TPA: thioredoxin domain-containing protein [Gaiellaceae bacterium]
MNRLAQETSPYLLQHADNPVDWYAWGDEAFAEARASDRPLLLSIGYAACHWCHVMAHESFEDLATAALMNELFVNVKVDREERPDVDSLYMDAVVSLTGSGGWPMTVFLTPDGEPFLGGTYFPPEPRHGLPSFRDVLRSVAATYRERRGDVTRQAQALTDSVRASARLEASREPLTSSLLHEAVRGLRSGFDERWGGWGHAPKFPQASTIEFLLRRGELEPATTTLDGMVLGGMYDLLGGGFHRYSVDERWLVPHFEKMLYDNALLVPAYLHGWLVTRNERYREIVQETVTYMLRELVLPEGGFASAQDADTDGVEGATFTWTPDEGVPQQFLEPFEHGRFVLRGDLPPALKRELLERREQRPKPMRDDKAIAAWNGLALAALAEAGRHLQNDTWLAAARRLGEFLLGPLSAPDGRLYRTYRNGVAKNTGFLEDYADIAHGLYELHVATGELRWLDESRRLALLAIELFGDEERGGFFLTPSDGEALIARKKDFDDHPTPSGNSMLAYVLLRLARIYGDDDLAKRATDVFRLVVNGLRPAPSAFGWTLCALDLHFSPPRELAIVAAPADEVARAALAPWQPNAVVAFGPADGVPLLEGKGRVDGRPTVYVCENFACRAPVTEPDALTV